MLQWNDIEDSPSTVTCPRSNGAVAREREDSYLMPSHAVCKKGGVCLVGLTLCRAPAHSIHSLRVEMARLALPNQYERPIQNAA